LTTIKGLSERASMFVMKGGTDVRSTVVRFPIFFLWRHLLNRLEFLCNVALSLEARREPMLDLALLSGFALFCLLVVYARLTHRL
jgi:hypothetical protein